MKREIKFRGKQYPIGEWIYGSLLQLDDRYYIVQNDDVEVDGHHLIFITDVPMFVDKDTIGQFTGLRDKNGREIYEGDIVKYFKAEIHSDLLCDAPLFYQHEHRIKEYQSVVEYRYGCIMVENDYLYGAAFESIEQAMECLGIDECCEPCDCEGTEVNESIIGYEIIGNIHDNPELIKEL